MDFPPQLFWDRQTDNWNRHNIEVQSDFFSFEKG